MNILDEHQVQKKAVENAPNKIIGWLGLFAFLVSFIGQLWVGATSESELVMGSYFWMPLLTLGVVGFILPPRKAILTTLFSLFLIFIFYQTIWSAL